LGSPSIIQNVSDRRRAQRARLGVTVTITVAGKLVDALGADVSPAAFVSSPRRPRGSVTRSRSSSS